MRQDSAGTYLTEGMYFDVNRLDAERQRITDNLLRNGYYKFNKNEKFREDYKTLQSMFVFWINK